MPITPRLWGDRGRRRAEALGLDPDRLPPGQSPTLKFPFLTVGPVPRVDTATRRFEVSVLVERPLALDWDALLALPRTELTTDIHCVTRWSKSGTSWRGVRVRELAAPLDDDVLVARTFDGAPLPKEHGGPARLPVPQRYFWKSAKWVRGIELLDRDRPGFWERNGPHDHGDPWREERRG